MSEHQDDSGELDLNEDERATVTIAVLTVSRPRTATTDPAGDLLAERASALGHTILKRLVLPAEREPVEAQLRAWVAEETIDVILVSGGVGLLQSDVTPDAVRAVLDREIPGFGEHVRRVRAERAGLSALHSRELAGIAAGTLIFALPAEPSACKDAWDALLGPELDPGSPASLLALLPKLADR